MPLNSDPFTISNVPDIWFRVAADLGKIATSPKKVCPANKRNNIGTPAHSSQDITGKLFEDKHIWSDVNSDAIKAWHKSCSLNHVECSKTLLQCESFSIEEACLPSRCVEIRPNCSTA